jgi:hypothetical protein
MTLIMMPDELDAMITSGRVAPSISANSLILSSGRSGAFSCTKSASATAFRTSRVNLSRSGEASAESPSLVTVSHAAALKERRASSACGAGSLAVT